MMKQKLERLESMPRSFLGDCRISDLEAECPYCGTQLLPHTARHGTAGNRKMSSVDNGGGE